MDEDWIDRKGPIAECFFQQQLLLQHVIASVGEALRIFEIGANISSLFSGRLLSLKEQRGVPSRERTVTHFVHRTPMIVL